MKPIAAIAREEDRRAQRLMWRRLARPARTPFRWMAGAAIIAAVCIGAVWFVWNVPDAVETPGARSAQTSWM